MRRAAFHLLCAFLTLLASSCGENDRFVIKAEVDGLGSQIVRVTYVGPEGMEASEAEARDGKFEFEGRSDMLTPVNITASNGRTIADLIAVNGDEILLSMKMEDPAFVKIEGSEISSELAVWKAENGGLSEASAINAAVARYVRAHPASAVSAWLLASQFYIPGNEAEAGELQELVSRTPANVRLLDRFTAAVESVGDPSQRMGVPPVTLYGTDSMVHFRAVTRPVHIFAFTGGKSDMSRDSVTAALRSLGKQWGTKRFRAIELSMVPDSVTWRSMTQADSAANWVRCWVPGSTAATALRRLKVPRTPFFVVVDSTSVQRYRGSSAVAAADTVKAILKK